MRVLRFTAVVAVAAGCGGGQAGEAEHASRPRLAAVTTRDIVVSASAAGVIEPITLVEVKSKASGEIVEVPVDEGDAVRANQLLVRVDPRIPLNALVQAEADSVVARAELDNADAQLERAEALHRTQAITDLEYEGAKLARATAYATLIRARRALEDAKIAFEDTEVRAPIAGVILGRPVEVGTVIASASRDVSGGVVLLRMASLDTVQVRALVDETDIGMIRPGMPVTTIVAAYPNRPFRGEVLRIGAEAVVEQNVTMFPVLVRIENGAGLLRPGMNAEVEIHIGAVDNAMAVPNAALRAPGELAGAAELVGLSPAAVRRQIATSGDTAALAEASSRRSSGGGGGGGGGGGTRAQGAGGRPAPRLFGGEYIVFVRRGGEPRALRVQTGLTDFAYTAVLSGLTGSDSVFILPTAGLLEEQQRRETQIRERVGGPLGQ
jgi:HlyD family secretion protein